MSLMPFFVIWACVALALMGLLVYRKLVSTHEDDFVHFAEGEARMITQQVEVAGKLDAVDRWTKILVFVALIGGVLLGAAYLYQLWQQSSQLR